MELKDAIELRASVRSFSEEPVSVDDIREMVRRAGKAPSVNNSQPWKYIAVTNRELLRKMAGDVHQKVQEILRETHSDDEKSAKKQVEWFSTFFEKAPVVIAVATCPYEAIVDRVIQHVGLSHDDMNAMRNHPDIQSLGASIQNLLLSAVDLGYGGCWLSGPLIAREGLERTLGIETPWKLAAMVAIGRPGRETKQSEKKPLEKIFELRD